MLKEREMDLLETKGWQKVGSDQNRFFLSQQYPSIYMDAHTTDCSYVLTGLYWIQILSLLTGSLLNQKTVYSCVLQGPIT
jgi:hypothetical protein